MPAGQAVPNGKPTSPYTERQASSPPNAQIAAQTVSSKDPKAAAQAASDMRNVVRRKLTGYVGFANLPNQWHRKSVRKGFNFNVMVVGMEPQNDVCVKACQLNGLQVNRASGNRRWSTPFSTLPCTLRKSARDRASISFLRQYRSSRSAQISRKTRYAFA